MVHKIFIMHIIHDVEVTRNTEYISKKEKTTSTLPSTFLYTFVLVYLYIFVLLYRPSTIYTGRKSLEGTINNFRFVPDNRMYNTPKYAHLGTFALMLSIIFNCLAIFINDGILPCSRE